MKYWIKDVKSDGVVNFLLDAGEIALIIRTAPQALKIVLKSGYEFNSMGFPDTVLKNVMEAWEAENKHEGLHD